MGQSFKRTRLVKGPVFQLCISLVSLLADYFLTRGHHSFAKKIKLLCLCISLLKLSHNKKYYYQFIHRNVDENEGKQQL